MTGFDVLIVGASIAGCTAATLFARHGLSVGLVERQTQTDAYKKVCTHFIQSSASPAGPNPSASIIRHHSGCRPQPRRAPPCRAAPGLVLGLLE